MTMLKTTFLILALAGTAFAGANEGWFDLENCGMCKNLNNDPELFQSMTWDNYLLTNGMMEVTTYPAGMKDRFDKLSASMQATGERLMAGEQMPMCGMCMSYGALMMKGVAMDRVETPAGAITVITSQDPEVVALIRNHAQTTINAYAEMMAGEEHPGHEHPSNEHPSNAH